ncbi:hypothetical protein E8E11_004716 [Didymella keratinophila]|nr:hypothetical protein E8E11_004716 [Didymella keratinophila]
MAPLKPVASFSRDGDTHLNNLNGFYEYQAYREDRSQLLPQGWMLHDHAEGHFYTKDDICEGESPYGFPLPSISSHRAGASVIISPVLLCTTKLGIIFSHYPYGHVLQTRVYNDRVRAGLILYGSMESLSGVAAGSEYHLIAISEAEVEHPNRMARWFYNQCGRSVEHAWQVHNTLMLRFYNILWVQWENGIAYRKVLGMMSKSTFDSLGPELCTFKLG